MIYAQIRFTKSPIPEADQLEAMLFLASEPGDPSSIVLERAHNPGEPNNVRRLFLCEQTAKDLVAAIYALTGTPVPKPFAEYLA